MSSQWSKWWWLRIFSIPRWSVDERRALGALGVIFLSIFLFAVLVIFKLLRGLDFEPHFSLAASIPIAILFAILNTRGIAGEIFPNAIRKGDDAAVERLGGSVFLPPEYPRLWWIDYRYTSRWSHEEQWTRNMIFVVALSIFVPSALFLVPHLMTWFGLSKRTSILLTMVTTLPLSFFIGRQFCVWRRPDFVKTADDNAVERYNRGQTRP
jgi:hypothetical protein